MNRAQQLLGQYRLAGEELYNQAFRGKMPEASFAAMEEYVHVMPMYDAFGCGERPHFINVPEAAPPSPSTPSNDVNIIMESMLLLQAMAPEQAAKILTDTAALQGPYED